MTRILRIDTSPRTESSTSRRLTDRIVERLSAAGPTNVVTRDLATPLPFVDATWVGATFTPPADRSDAQKEALAFSDTLVSEVESADVLVIGVPMYNFGVPAVLKAWIDLVARVGVTFKYTQEGPVGLLSGKRAILAIASGGTKVGTDIDFVSGYLRHFLGFLGITDVEIVRADAQMADAAEAEATASRDLNALDPAA